MRRQITLKNRIYSNSLFIIMFFSSYPACHSLIADLDGTERNKRFTKRYLHSCDLYVIRHSARRPPAGHGLARCRAASSPCAPERPRTMGGLERSGTETGPPGVGFQKWLEVTVSLSLLICYYVTHMNVNKRTSERLEL